MLVSAARAPQIPARYRPIHALPEAELLLELAHLNGTPSELLQNRELMQIMLPILRADFALYETYAYAPEPPLGCRISSFGGLGDSRVGRDDLEAWRDQTTASCSLRMFPGDHFYLNAGQPKLLEAIWEELRGDV